MAPPRRKPSARTMPGQAGLGWARGLRPQEKKCAAPPALWGERNCSYTSLHVRACCVRCAAAPAACQRGRRAQSWPSDTRSTVELWGSLPGEASCPGEEASRGHCFVLSLAGDTPFVGGVCRAKNRRMPARGAGEDASRGRGIDFG
ncbi:hypothetical protein TRVL_09390 [Trypanosoma vivax]|nr:hypothetical protein TRVL_09390 [Trypanosoma vivax]